MACDGRQPNSEECSETVARIPLISVAICSRSRSASASLATDRKQHNNPSARQQLCTLRICTPTPNTHYRAVRNAHRYDEILFGVVHGVRFHFWKLAPQ